MTLPHPMPSAATITVAQTLLLIEKDFPALLRGVADGTYAFWLGSGISMHRVAGLPSVVERVLTFLQRQVDHTNPECRFRVALEEVLDYADLSAAERAATDVHAPPAAWTHRALIISRLVRRYSDVLDVRVDGEPDDYLLWDGVDVVNTFHPGLDPDAEHLLLAILMLEGVATDVASANWDGLIESAVGELAGAATGILNVHVSELDYRAAAARAKLLKFHGCAVRAAADPATYRALLIARKSQITDWPNEEAHAVARQALVSLAATRPTLMIGLSAQDTDIQDMFSRAKQMMPWQWPNPYPAHVFSGDKLGASHRSILKVVYRDDYSVNARDIEQGALIRAYAKPLLAALVLGVLSAKMKAYLQAANAPKLDPAERRLLEEGLIHLRSRSAAHAEPDLLAFVKTLVSVVSEALSLFREGSRPRYPSRYVPVSASATRTVATDPTLATSGMPELATALAVLGVGDLRGDWTVGRGPTTLGTFGVLRLHTATGEAAIVFAATGRAEIEMEVAGVIDRASRDVVLIHGIEPVRPSRRSPRAAPGRTGVAVSRPVHMGDVLKSASTVDDLVEEFRRAAVL